MSGAVAAAGFGLALSAALIYLILRFVVATPSPSEAVKPISQHAFWTAVIAFFASGTSGLMNLWAHPDPQNPSEASIPALLMHAAAPGLWLGVVYILGQFTWPRHLRPVRSASLEVRSVKAVIPKALAGVLVASAAISAVLVAFAWNDPGAEARTTASSGIDYGFTQPWDGSQDEYGNPLDEWGEMMSTEELEAAKNWVDPQESDSRPVDITGTKPGPEVAPYLAGGLALVLLSTLGTTVVMVRRPPLQSLDPQDNDVLRVIWINRLLRTGILVASGFGMASLSYVAEGIRARSMWAQSVAENSVPIDREAESLANLLTGGGTVWMLVVVIMLVAWKPPTLTDVGSHHIGFPDSISTERISTTATRARDFLFLAQCVGVMGIGAVVFIAGAIPSADQSQSSGTELLLETVAVQSVGLGSFAALYLLLQLAAAFILKRRLAGTEALSEPRTELLPLWFIVLGFFPLAIFMATATTFMLGALPGTGIIVFWTACVVAVTAALAVLLYRFSAHRPALEGASEQEDLDLRVLLAHRGARTLGAVALMATSILGNTEYPDGSGATGFQVTCILASIAFYCLPASTAMGRRTAKPRPGVSTRV